jgi:hypothetical protein
MNYQFFYKGEIHATHLLYILIFYIAILCYPIFFLVARILFIIMHGSNCTYEKITLVANSVSSTQHV